MMTLPTPSDSLRGLYFQHLAPFVDRSFAELRPGTAFHLGFHIRAMCHQLERLERGEIRKLMILIPPRHGKSHSVSVAFPVWALGRNPARRLVTVSYGSILSETFSRESRRLMESGLCRSVFPALKIDPRKASVEELLTTLNGGRFVTSVGGAITGRGGDIVFLDDPIKADDVSSRVKRDGVWDWYWESAITRLDNPKKGAVILIAQRLHQDDLPGRLMAAEPDEWVALELPAIETQSREILLGDGMVWYRDPGDVLCPEHMGREELEKIRKTRPDVFAAQYQQCPIPAGGFIVRPEWFCTYEVKPNLSAYEAILQSWDTAHLPGESNDYSVCTTWGLIGNHIDLLDVFRSREVYPDLLNHALKLRQKWKPNVITIERASSGLSLVPDLHRRGVEETFWLSPEKGKEARMVSVSLLIASGEVRLPKSAPWKEAFLAEVVAFPHGDYDDQADSMSQALRTITYNHTRLRHCSRFKGQS